MENASNLLYQQKKAMRNKKRRMIFSILSLLVMVVGAGAGLYILQKENLELRREAEVTREAGLLLVPSVQQPIVIEPDASFDMTLYLDTSNYEVVGTDIILDISENLSLENITLPTEKSFSTYVPVQSDGTFDVAKAIAQHGFGAVTFNWDNTETPIQAPIKGSVVLATLTFKGISEGEGSVAIFYGGDSGTDSSTDSNVVHIDVNGNVHDVLKDPGTDGNIPVVVSTTPIDTCNDNDGDGYNGYDQTSCELGTDCNDNDDSIYPNSTEVCNNKDDDCDDQVDENLERACVGSNNCQGTEQCLDGSWGSCDCPVPPCVDKDGDGYDAYDASSCPLGTDCDDTNANIHPQATESCNNVDDNCDENIDENVTQDCTGSNNCQGAQQCTNGNWDECVCPITCVDSDGDGYDAYDATKCPLGNDCNDSTNKIHPDAQEYCNLVDDNCNGSVDENLTQSCIGPNGCSGQQSCIAGDSGPTWDSCQCEGVTCTPHCSGIQCGDDGCGHSCGTCSNRKICSSSLKCVSIYRAKNASRARDLEDKQIALIVGSWNAVEITDESADVNNDGQVNIYDAAKVLATEEEEKPPKKKNSSLYLSVSDSTEEIVEGDEFNVDVNLNTQGEDIVGLTADFTYDSNAFEVVAVSTQDSVFDTSIEESAENGFVQLSQIKQGNPFSGEGTIARVSMKPKIVGNSLLSFKTENAVMNSAYYDVLGKQDELSLSIKEKSFWGKLEDKIAENPFLAAGVIMLFSAVIGLAGYIILRLIRKEESPPTLPPKKDSGGSQQKRTTPINKESDATPVATPPTPLEQGA